LYLNSLMFYITIFLRNYSTYRKNTARNQVDVAEGGQQPLLLWLCTWKNQNTSTGL